jgi:hypothetical protein
MFNPITYIKNLSKDMNNSSYKNESDKALELVSEIKNTLRAYSKVKILYEQENNNFSIYVNKDSNILTNQLRKDNKKDTNMSDEKLTSNDVENTIMRWFKEGHTLKEFMQILMFVIENTDYVDH